MPTFGSLFAGIGGIDLGLERAGWTCRFQVEWDEYCQHVLAHHWPDVPRFGDIHAVHGWRACPSLSDADRQRLESVGGGGLYLGGTPQRDDLDGLGCPGDLPSVDLLAGGFPCQPFSNAGKRRGVEDERWLWPEFARTIRELRPRYVLVENVPGLLAGHGGMGRVLGDLAELGYDAEWDSIPAAAVGAPHLRYRVWIVAWDRLDRGLGRSIIGDIPAVAVGQAISAHRGREGSPAARRAFDVADPQGVGLREPREASDGVRETGHPSPLVDGAGLAYADGPRLEGWGLDRQRPCECPPGACGRSHPGDWLPEPDVGRVAHGVPARVDRLRALGNAVVPQVVEVIGRRLLEAEAEVAA